MTDRELKRSVADRIRTARAAGLTTGQIVKLSEYNISFSDIYGVLEAQLLPIETYKRLDKELKAIGL